MSFLSSLEMLTNALMYMHHAVCEMNMGHWEANGPLMLSSKARKETNGKRNAMAMHYMKVL